MMPDESDRLTPDVLDALKEEYQTLKEVIPRALARDSLLDFCQLTHPRWLSGPHHREIAKKLEGVEKGEIKRLLIEAPPRHGKSEISTVRFPAWYLGKHDDQQIITASYGGDLAVDFGREVRNLVNSPEYQMIFPGTGLRADAQAAGRWRTTGGGSYLACGVGGALTGFGGHIVLIDDPLKNEQEAESGRVRERIWRWYNSALMTRLMPGGAVVLIMTRWHEDDLAGRLLKQEGWDVLSLPAIKNEGTIHERALWPAWFPISELRKIRKERPARTWAALYQQKPRVEEGAYIRREWFSERYELGKLPTEVRIYIHGDLAVTSADEDAEADPDFTELGVTGIGADEKLYPLDWRSGQTTADAWIDDLLDLVKIHKPFAIFLEAGVIRRAIEPFLKRRAKERRVYGRYEWLPSLKDKQARGRPFQALSSMRRIVFPSTPWADAVIDQCVGFPSTRYDDKFDAMSILCQAIDQAHPAILAGPATKKANDRWFNREDDDDAIVSWRVV